VRGNPSTSRALNRRLILNLLRNNGPMPRAEIATVTGLSPAAVTFVINELIGEAYVIEGEAQTGATGRRPIPVDINYDGHLAVGFKLRQHSIDCVLTDLATTPIVSLSAPVADTGAHGMVDAITRSIPELLSKAKRESDAIIGIGVSIPGEVDAANGVCIQSPRFGWHNLPFADILGEKVHVPVWIDDDVNAFTVAQRLFGAGRQYKNFVTLAVGTGIGSSLVVNGELFRGSHGAAGKLGHITAVEGGRLCECGRRGCLMAHAAEPAMVEDWGRAKGFEATRADFAAAIDEKDEKAIAVMTAAGEMIGRHLADLVNLFDPEVVVAGGESMQFGDAILEPIKAAMEKYLFFAKPELLPDWVPDSWARGAAALATQHFFNFEIE
jgi:predicted NBD/HSP70 family sugar kinase